eukprot:Skav211439  [mRNA]  locus=scaffold1591:226230:240786:- [translate_table: standard]
MALLRSALVLQWLILSVAEDIREQLLDDCEVEAENCSVSFRQLRARASPSCSILGCHGSYVRGQSCQCTEQCKHYRNCCADYDAQCAPSKAPPVIPFETELYLQFLDDFLAKQPRQKFLKCRTDPDLWSLLGRWQL